MKAKIVTKGKTKLKESLLNLRRKTEKSKLLSKNIKRRMRTMIKMNTRLKA